MPSNAIGDYKDIYIRWQGHPKYDSNQIIQDDLIEVIVQKLEMMLFTNRYSVLGDEGFTFGGDLEYYLWKTSISNLNLKKKITEQITQFIPELDAIGYDLTLDIFEGTYQDIMQLNFTIKGYNIYFVFN